MFPVDLNGTGEFFELPVRNIDELMDAERDRGMRSIDRIGLRRRNR